MSVNKYKKLFKNNAKRKKVIVLDWLTLTVDDLFANLEYEKGQAFHEGYVITHREGQRTQQFNQIAEIHREGKRVAILTYESSNPLILKDRAQIKFENELFYSGEIESQVNDLISAFNLQNVSVSRADIAVDGVYLHDAVNYFVKQSVKSEIYEESGRDYKNAVVRVRDTDNISFRLSGRRAYVNSNSDQFYVGEFGSRGDGRKRSTRLIRYYNKSKELRNKPDKQYIEDFYKRNEIDGEVYRFEMQLSSAYLSSLAGFELSHLFDPQKLKDLLHTSCKNFFEFAWNTDSNISRCERIDLFGYIEHVTFYVKVKRFVKNSIRTIKIGIKRDIQDCYTGLYRTPEMKSERDALIDVVFDKIRHYDLSEWFSRVVPSLYDQMERKANQLNFSLPSTQLKMFA